MKTSEDVLEKAFRSIDKHFLHIKIVTLPSIPIVGGCIWVELPEIPAIYFVRGHRKETGPHLSPHHDWTVEDDDDGESPEPEEPPLLYVGKAIDLRKRFCGGGMLSLRHHALEKTLACKNVTLRWLEMDRRYLVMVESVLIQTWRPTWNVHDLATDRFKGWTVDE